MLASANRSTVTSGISRYRFMVLSESPCTYSMLYQMKMEVSMKTRVMIRSSSRNDLHKV